MRSAVFGASESDFQSAEMYDTPLYLLARDEDCENSFHSTADFVSLNRLLLTLYRTVDEYVSCL